MNEEVKTDEFKAPGLEFFKNPQCPPFNDVNYCLLIEELMDDSKVKHINPQQMIAISTWLNVCSHVIGVIQ